VLWDIRIAAGAMGLSVHTLYSWISQRRIAYVKAGRRVMFDPRDIQAWIEANKVHPELMQNSKLT
jgi:excisionase family DNA binding protein